MDGEAALRILSLLRDELEEFERQQAARALASGRSYRDVARALDISRQAAHRRFRDVAPGTANASAGQLRASAQVRQAVAWAGSEARALGATAVEPQHLLLGILRTGDSRAASALLSAGVTYHDARREVAAVGCTSAPRPAGAATRHVLDRAVGFARRDRAERIEIEHLLRGVMKALDGAPESPLRRLKVPVAPILAVLEAEACAGRSRAALPAATAAAAPVSGPS